MPDTDARRDNRRRTVSALVSRLLIQGTASHLPLASESVQCVVTSPPYWSLRKYAGVQTTAWADGSHDALGHEFKVDAYVTHMVEVFREVRRVLKGNGVVWLNLGDSYTGSWGAQGRDGQMADRSVVSAHQIEEHPRFGGRTGSRARTGLPDGNLIGVPWRVFFALQADGWIGRAEVVWAKPNAMPESVRDRPTRSHESLFLFAKRMGYFYDRAAILEPLAESSIKRIQQETFDQQTGGAKDYANGTNPNRSMRRTLKNFRDKTLATPHVGGRRQAPEPGEPGWANEAGRNKRDVWTIPTSLYAGAHYATFPEALVEPCILAGSAPGDTILDPFTGSGTTGRVALRHGRSYVGIDVSREYLAEQATKRTTDIQHALTEAVS